VLQGLAQPAIELVGVHQAFADRSHISPRPFADADRLVKISHVCVSNKSLDRGLASLAPVVQGPDRGWCRRSILVEADKLEHGRQVLITPARW
jgi:hypothetical protein